MRLFARIRAWAAVAALAVVSTPAQGGYVFRFDDVAPKIAVSYTLDGVGSGNTYAGRMNWSQPAPTADDVPWLGQQFWTFCIEVGQHVSYGATYSDYLGLNLENAPAPGAGAGGPGGAAGPMQAAKADAIRRLFGYTTGTLGINVSSPGLDKIDAAALQIAIWEIVFEDALNTAWNATDGEFRITSNSADSDAAEARANLWLTHLRTNTVAPTTFNVIALSSPTAQDQLVVINPGWTPGGGGTVSPVPAPPAVVLGLAGVLPLVTAGWARRRLAGA
jgi:hypothetical protein